MNADARGAGDSEGDVRYWGYAEGEDGYDLIEQIAVQPWCSGRVALAGNLWLAMSQWFIAAQQPPHLTAIAPLEGVWRCAARDACSWWSSESWVF